MVINTRFKLSKQTSKVLLSITSIQGIASQFETQLNDKDEVLLYIKELNCNGQNIKTNIAINMKQQIQKSTESAILYKQIKKKIKKFNQVFQKSGQKQLLTKEIIQHGLKKDQEQVPRKNSESLTITNNDISYIKYLESLSNGISKKYVIEFFKKQKIRSEKFINIMYPSLQIEQELFEFQ
ncbi:unnamed protein product (macronuclear) [Paramecium tetraurelia]|uniref:Uncharacterized protein n=1 Tax=Paramecium tetraurelia TaxID=5888 RepID=A0CEN6_PARTE|nr:uncharacterized protein GSPATT00037692001 [Paramecium tetraurelia]CAK69253.1 unnamed protein product [Paramecium tetraurelia]|eukprot:XP_001436650.1 hypothetical protein (macronuclear) [Paramecium tetraurelia strain d4-2]